MNFNGLRAIHPEAQIAENVQIDPFVSIGKDVVIGRGTWIGPHVSIMDGARIGENCKIFPGAVISAVPQDLKYRGEETYAIIGNNTTIREYCTINKGTSANVNTEVGDNCLLMAYVHVAHDCVVQNNVIMANNVTLAGHIHIGNHVVLGGMVAVQQFVRIGDHVMVGGGSLVRKDVPPFVKAAREPLSYAGVNSIGLKRRGFSQEQINAIQDIYRILYVKGHNIKKALELVETTLPESAERTKVLDFINSSKRGGLMRGFRSLNTARLYEDFS